jgi:hypothetical protein
MSEGAIKAALERRRAATPNADKAAAEFAAADDAFTTCQRCKQRVKAVFIGGAWIIVEHTCGDSESP